MCGIVGYVGNRPAVDILLKGLKRLEYRGYDSAGVAFFINDTIEVRKSQGKLENIEKLLDGEASHYKDATCGIGHTRWATHGKPTTQNAHPHRTGHVVLVHNGIIENYQEIKRELIAARTYAAVGDRQRALRLSRAREDGQGREPARCRARKLCPARRPVQHRGDERARARDRDRRAQRIADGRGQGSARRRRSWRRDGQPLLEVTRDVVFLEHGDVVVGTRDSMKFFDLKSGKPVERRPTRLEWSLDKLDKQGYPHYMLKEIHEQPATIIDTLNGLLDRAQADPFPLASSRPSGSSKALAS